MLAITLGFTAPGRSASPVLLYCGLDAAAANELSLNPPPGILRTEMFKNPPVIRRRHFILPPAAEPLQPDPLQLEPTDPAEPLTNKAKARGTA